MLCALRWVASPSASSRSLSAPITSPGVNVPMPSIFAEKPRAIVCAIASASSQMMPSTIPGEKPLRTEIYSANSRVELCPNNTICG